MKNFLYLFLTIVAGLAILLLLILIASYGISGSERTECLQWKSQAVDYRDKGFYLTGWQQAQCDHYGIDIDAPAK